MNPPVSIKCRDTLRRACLCLPSCVAWPDRQCSMSDKEYDVGVTNIEDVNPGSSTVLVNVTSSVSTGDCMNSCPPDQELGALTKELAIHLISPNSLKKAHISIRRM